ncbi:MAG TPA: anthranilate synthase component I family protein [Pirellulales bacterium]|nr:anthranilate synthase component I family protein [Pirellulales bacterium]
MTPPTARNGGSIAGAGLTSAGISDDTIAPYRAAEADESIWIEELHPAPAAEAVFRRLSVLPHCLYLDSARRDRELGRYSFVAADPFDFTEARHSEQAADPLADLARRMAAFSSAPIAGLPPFQGGAAGLLSYDFAHRLERLPPPRCDEFEIPTMAMGLYDLVVAFDHFEGRAWIISQGFPEIESPARRRRARGRAQQFRQLLETSQIGSRPDRARSPNSRREIDAARLAPQFSIDERFAGDAVRGARLTSNFSPERYIATVARAIEYIRAGDIFQVNLSQRLLCPATDDSVSLYLRLRERNPAPMAGYFDLGEFQIVSASPERFLRVADGRVEARPIKGTRRRTARPEADLFAGDELRESEKDNAENVMIVDLLRNDLARVCLPESVTVSELCRLEVFEFVQHLVSVVQAELTTGNTAIDLIRAAFPGGSISGAPKIRAMQIIAELEPTARGAYCGCLGFLGFDGSMDMNLLIRTITAGRGWWQMPVGGGIVAQSDPVREYEETWHKAEGMIRALG